MAVYIFYPNCQNLRPQTFPRKNFLTDCIGLLYAVDTNTGVCPSLHCAYSIGIASVWLRAKGVAWQGKLFVLFAAILICLSTMFIKQHSAVDFFAALLVCLLAEILVFGVFYKKKKLTIETNKKKRLKYQQPSLDESEEICYNKRKSGD